MAVTFHTNQEQPGQALIQLIQIELGQHLQLQILGFQKILIHLLQMEESVVGIIQKRKTNIIIAAGLGKIVLRCKG